MCRMFPTPSQTFTIKKTQYQRAAYTQFHEPINTAFALIIVFSSLEKSDKSYQEDVHYCQALSDGNGCLAITNWRFPNEDWLSQLREWDWLFPDSPLYILLARTAIKFLSYAAFSPLIAWLNRTPAFLVLALIPVQMSVGQALLCDLCPGPWQEDPRKGSSSPKLDQS